MTNSWQSDGVPIEAAARTRQPRQGMLGSFLKISSISGLSLAVGFCQNIAIAAIIGATASKDAYDIAWYLPRTMLYMFGLDLFQGISISLFSRLDVNKSEDPSEVFSSILNIVILISLVAILMAEVFANPIVQMIGHGLPPHTAHLAVKLARFIIPTVALISVTGLIGSVLLANHYYGLTEALTILPKLAILVGVLLLGKVLDVWALVLAAIIGLAAQLPVMVYFLRRCGLRYSLILRVDSPATRAAVVDALPIGIGTVFVYMSELLLQRTASYGEEGTVACFNYSLLLCGTLATLVSRPASASLAPRITRTLEQGDYQTSCRLLRKSVGLVVLASLACASIMWTEAPIVVSLIFGRGRFDAKAIEQTSAFLSIMFLGVLGTGVRMIGIRVLLARRMSITIMLYCLLSSALRASLATAGRSCWGVYASPIAYIGGSSFDGLLTILTAILIVGVGSNCVSFFSIARWLAACVVVVTLPVIPHFIRAAHYTDSFWTQLRHLIIVCVLTCLSLALAARIIGLYSVKNLSEAINNRIRKSSDK